ncbi:uncharacterized protein LOC121381957 [Gigantopelta aegis]|uniref:uncharacterized protein LOC121381957 n=1 Tax=Gigantopelta aegis TaxID=1735272 RepID=UPI001B888857|nr:uncharacterized protein LOC121381957 [Gigantopelta aegis]
MEISETENYTPVFVVVDQGTDRGKPKLIETIGYAYTRKKVNGDRINWTCSVRGTHNWCKATVNQNGNIFSRGKVEHNHQAKPGLLHRTEENKQVKTLAAEHIFRSAKEIVESVKLAADQVENIQSDSCTFDSWARKANRHRKKFRPDDPKDLQFDVDVEYLCSVDSDAETFFQASVCVNEQRHLIFATPAQVHQLAQAKTWYVDGTFKIMAPPFVQLFGLHAFVRSGETMTQVPLAFVLMSRRQTIDYLGVFNSLLEKMQQQPQVRRVVSDFEAATWAAIRAVLPHVELKGCLFHWTQAVFKRIRQEGLEKSYHDKGRTYVFLKQVLSLPYLPAEDIEEQFERLCAVPEIPPKVENVLAYMKRTWFRSSVWKVENWSIFGLPIRTNNNTEGWHRRINARATRDGIQFYLLVPLLLREAKLVKMTMERVSDGRLGRLQRSKQRTRQGEVFQIWTQYHDGEISAKHLLRAIGHLL